MKEAPEIGEREQELYLSRQNELRSSLEIKQEQINQRTNELKELNVKLAELNKTYALFQKEIEVDQAARGPGRHFGDGSPPTRAQGQRNAGRHRNDEAVHSQGAVQDR